MRKIIIVLFIAPFFSFGQEKINTEEFRPFLEQFYSDSVFQFSRIAFPLAGGEIGNGDYIPQDIADSLAIKTETRTQWIKNEFIQKLHPASDYGVDYLAEYTKIKNYIEEKLYLKASGYYEIRRFELIENRWFLTYFFIHNL